MDKELIETISNLLDKKLVPINKDVSELKEGVYGLKEDVSGLKENVIYKSLAGRTRQDFKNIGE